MAKPGFGVMQNKGFHIKFENNWTASVQFGPGNYCQHYPRILEYGAPQKAAEWESESAEVAAWDANGNWHEFENDQVKGYQSPQEVLAFLNLIAAKPHSEATHESV